MALNCSVVVMAMEGFAGEMAMDFRVAAGGGLEPPGLEPELELEPPQLERRRARLRKATSLEARSALSRFILLLGLQNFGFAVSARQ